MSLWIYGTQIKSQLRDSEWSSKRIVSLPLKRSEELPKVASIMASPWHILMLPNDLWEKTSYVLCHCVYAKLMSQCGKGGRRWQLTFFKRPSDYKQNHRFFISFFLNNSRTCIGGLSMLNQISGRAQLFKVAGGPAFVSITNLLHFR